jgi:hypothetical protein
MRNGMKVTPAQLAAHYRGYATQCLIMAQRLDSAGDRLALLDMAQAWIDLAEQAEHETPDPEDPEDLH